jgi:hypothetical protein
MPRIFNLHREELGVTALAQELSQASEETESHLRTSAAVIGIERADISGGRLTVEVEVTNLAGHKLPTAYPSRRAWIRLQVRDSRGSVVFESGRVNPDGSIRGNANDRSRDRYERHHTRIDSPDQVQIYEAIMAAPDGDVTTGLIEAIRFIKDNRVLPRGFDKASAGEDIAVRGGAARDEDFSQGGDRVRYSLRIDPDHGPYTVRAELLFQPIAFRWAQNLKQQRGAEIERFTAYYDSVSERSWTVLTRDERTVR